MKLSNKWYDTLKWIALILLPALSVFYAGLAGLWNLPYGELIPASIMLFDTLLGVLLGISTAKYNKK